jgi:hypothetical protein
MKHLFALCVAFVLLTGCVSLVDSAFREQAQVFNRWIDQTKDARVMVVGPPNRCTTLTNGGETCAWVFPYSNSEGVVSFTYDSLGVARFWSFRGLVFLLNTYVWADFTSKDYPYSRPVTTTTTTTEGVFGGAFKDIRNAEDMQKHLDAWRSTLDSGVQKGKLTQEEADRMYQERETLLLKQLNISK